MISENFGRHSFGRVMQLRQPDRALRAQEGDELVWVAACTSADSVLLAASDGLVTRFRTDDAQVCMSTLPYPTIPTPACQP